MNRRRFLTTSAFGTAAAGLLPTAGAGPLSHPRLGRAEHVIHLWLGGGMAQMDTFDPKTLGDPKGKKPGSYYPAITTAVPGVTVCEHLPQVASVMDRITAVRTVFHDVIDEHAAASNRMHTGRRVSGTVVYPSLGSLVSAARGPLADGLPPYVVIGYPSPMRGPGFLGAKHGYLYLTDTEAGPAGLTRPADITADRQVRRESLLASLRRETPHRDYDAAIDQSLKLAGPDFLRVFALKEEKAATREAYGGEFGQRCLRARRLVERGVRFVEVAHNMNFVNGTGWDAHNGGIRNQHLLIRELDAALATLIRDLEARGLLERTLIVVGTEFGRPAEFDSGGGRGHHAKAFSAVLAGGGLRHTGAYGVTDDLAKNPVQDPVSVPDLFATIFSAIGVAPDTLLYDGDRPVPLTDSGRALPIV